MSKIMKNKLFVILCFYWISNLSFAKNDVNKVLDTFHHAAAEADQKLYFSLLDEQAVFLGTDGTERWTKEEFSIFVTPYFSQGKGWLYQPTSRNITLIKQTNLAFFDELLENKNYGQCRGSGVLIYRDNQWKILQYNLSIPVPNALSREIVTIIRSPKSGIIE
jgi:hypothetical protein